MRPRFTVLTVPAGAANDICQTQTPSGTTPLTLNGTLVTAGVGVLSSGLTTVFTTTGGCWQRRIRLTCNGSDAARTLTVVGQISVDGKLYTIGEVLAGTNGSTTDSLNGYENIISLVPDASYAGSVTVGTSTNIGETPWLRLDTDNANPFAVGIGCTLLSGSATFTVEHTFDKLPPNPGSGYIATANYTPRVFPHSSISAKTATIDGNYAFPISGLRMKITSGTGVVMIQACQAGQIGGPGVGSGEWST